MKRIVLLMFIIAMFSISIFSQKTNEDPLGCASEKSESLNFLVGTWNVNSKFRLSRSENKWEQTNGTAKITHLFKNCIYQEVLNGTRNGRPHQFTGLFSYNNLSEKLQWVGGHSEHGVLTLYEGNFEDGELKLKNQMTLRSNIVYFRIVVTKTRDGFDVRSERSRDGKLWDAGWYRSYTRK
jgi:hypothetical protein